MKKLLHYLVPLLAAVFFALPGVPKGEAASVALLPLINNTENEELGTIYFTAALEVLKEDKFADSFELVDNDAINAAVEANLTSGGVPAPEALQQIARDGKVDVVLGIVIDKLEDNKVVGGREQLLKLDMQGYAFAYNSLNNANYKHRVYSDKEIDEALTTRWNWVNEEFARAVRSEVRRALSAKK